MTHEVETIMETFTHKTQLPPIIFGSSGLGNLYEDVPYSTKLAIIRECVQNAPGGIAMFDTAGKYGAGLALEVLGKALKELGVPKEKVIISNKLGWYRVPLTTPEPTFEKDIWVNIQHDAEQRISYQGILDCWQQGNELLGDYPTNMASIHDPDEYLAAAIDEADDTKRYQDILDAYQALFDLKQQGKITAIGVGAKNWRSIQRIAKDIQLDWVMIANSLSVHSHPAELIAFVNELHQKGVTVINSAVFNGGFLVGRDFYNYKLVDNNTAEGKALFDWREKFFALCNAYQLEPAEACFNFGFNIPGIDSVALSTSLPEKVRRNIDMATKQVPAAFWQDMKQQGLLQGHYEVS